MQSSTLSRATMGRLPLYLQFVRTVKTEMVSSAAVARGLGLGEVQVRKDLASICTAGMPKVGYPSDRLRSDLEKVLGMQHTEPAVIVGAGRLGRALMEYDGFREYGMEISAAFDISGTDESHEGIPILQMDQMRRWCLLHVEAHALQHQVVVGVPFVLGVGGAEEVLVEVVAYGARLQVLVALGVARMVIVGADVVEQAAL